MYACCSKELLAVQKDLQTRQLRMFAETENLRRCEQRAYSAEQQVAALQSANVKLQICVDELRMKYEPGTILLSYCYFMKQMLKRCFWLMTLYRHVTWVNCQNITLIGKNLINTSFEILHFQLVFLKCCGIKKWSSIGLIFCAFTENYFKFNRVKYCRIIP